MKAKKLLSLILSFVLILACIPVTMAAGVPTLEVAADKEYVTVGDIVNYTVTLKGADSFEDGVWNVTFKLDLPEGLTCVEGTVADGFADATAFQNVTFNLDTLMFTSFGAMMEGYKGGDIVCMTFGCEVTAESGDLTASLMNTDLSDGYNSHEANVVVATVKSHEHAYEWVVKTPAQCGVAGVEEYVCSFCGNIADTREIAALEHVWGEGVVTTPATCTTPGVLTYTCELCGQTKTEEISVTEHTEEIIPAVPATCTTAGLTEGVKCSVCGLILVAQEEIPALDHTWDEGVETTPATCVTPGVKTYTCTVCGETKTEEIPVVGHTEEIIPAVPATCTETGLTEGKKCSVCGEILVAQETVAALGHAWNNGEVTVKPGCETEGVMTYTCLNGCGETYTVAIAPHGHDWVYMSETETEYIFECSHCHSIITQPKDGSVVVVVLEDGTVVITTTYEDGSVVIERRYTNGVRSFVYLNAKGEHTKIEVVIYGATSYEAVRTDVPVLLPIAHLFEEYGADMVFTLKTNCDKKVPVTIQLPAGQFGAGHVVVIVDGEKETYVAATKLADEGIGFDADKVLVLKVADKTMSFSDIAGDNWYNKAVDFVSARGIMTGMTATTFAPTSTTTRAQVWTMLARLAGVDTTSTEGNWYDVARAWAMENGISDGTGANDSITREQLVTMLYRFAQMKGASKSIAGFSDADQVSDWAEAALKWAYGMGVMNGNADGTLNPKGNTTRAEMAQFFMNFIQNI